MVVYCVTMIRDVMSMESEAVSEGRVAVGGLLDVRTGSAREVALTRGVEEDA